MKKIVTSFIIFSMLSAEAPGYLLAISDSFPSFSGAFGGNSMSTSYSNISSMGQLSGDSTSLNYRSYGGFLPSQVKVIDLNITFFDESPASNESQDGTAVTPKITVQITGGNTIAQVKYRLSNSGSADSNFYSWQSDAAVDSVIDASKTRYKITIPNAAGQGFIEGDNNYIQWQAINNNGAQGQSGIYRVRVSVNDTPAIVITQPDIKSNYTSLTPYIAASVTDQYGEVDATSIQIKIDNASGTNVATIKSSDDSSIFDAAKNIISYKYSGPALSADVSYTLTVSVTDKLGKTGSASAVFIPKSGEIADLIPYPSPFDPKVQPVVIRYVLSKRSDVWVNIYDMSGRIVKTVTEAQSKDPGICEDRWQGTNFGGEELANGVYFCEIVAKNDEGEFRRYSSLAIFGK